MGGITRDTRRLIKRLQIRDEKLSESLVELLTEFQILRCEYDKVLILLKLKVKNQSGSLACE